MLLRAYCGSIFLTPVGTGVHIGILSCFDYIHLHDDKLTGLTVSDLFLCSVYRPRATVCKLSLDRVTHDTLGLESEAGLGSPVPLAATGRH